MNTLVLESSTYAGSVALLRDGRLLCERRVAMRGKDHEALMPAIAEVLAEGGVAPLALDRVVCGAGPGAFTSLRISGAIAKGLALAGGIPLIPVSSLALVVASRVPFEPGRYLAAMDAMRGEHYVQRYDVGSDGALEVVSEVGLVASATVDDMAARLNARVCGPGRGAGPIAPLAASAVNITNMINATAPADLARWEPGYGRLAEAQVKWEAAHGAPLSFG